MKSKILFNIAFRIIFLIVFGTGRIVFAQGPTLDPSFGDSGIVKANLGYGASGILSSVIFPDDKIIFLTVPFPYSYSCDLHRLLPNGQLDENFGDHGKLIFPYSLNADFERMIEDSTGRIILAGYSLLQNDSASIVLLRLNEDGVTDSSFGINGQVRVYLHNSEVDPESLQLGNGQKLILTTYPGIDNSEIFRLTANGKIDSSFNKVGILNTSQISNDSRLVTIAARNDGSLILALISNASNSILLLNSDGSVNNSFNADWIKSFNEFGFPNDVRFKATSDNKILMSMYIYNKVYGPYYFISRILGNGSTDFSFGSNGFIYSDILSEETFLDFITDKEGKLLITEATFSDTTSSDTGVYKRFTQNGLPDYSFGDNGETRINYAPGNGWSNIIQLQSNNDIVGTGFIDRNGVENDAIVGLSTDGHLNINFGNDGLEIISDGESDDYLVKIYSLPDERILTGGIGYTESSYFYELGKFSSNGIVDSAFASNGVYLGVSNSEDFLLFPRGYFLLPNNEIGVSGNYFSYSNAGPGNYIFFNRLFDNGRIDSAYGKNGTIVASTPNLKSYIMDEVMQHNEKIIVNATQSEGASFICRYNVDGTLDSTFGKDDTVSTFLPDSYEVDKLHLQEDGKIVASNGGNDGSLAKRFFSSGNIDSSYGKNGIAAVNGLTFTTILNSTLTSDNKLLLIAESDSVNDFIVFVLDSTGKLDSSFNLIGYYSMSTDSNRYWMKYITASPDLKNYLITGTYSAKGHNLLDIIDLTSNGKLDSTFGINGELRVPIFGNDQGIFIKFLPDNSMLIGGDGTSLNNSELGYGVDIFILKFLPIIATSTIILPQLDNKLILVYPTPLHDHATVQFDLPTYEQLDFTLRDASGKLIEDWRNITGNAGQNSIALQFSNQLTSGWYTLQVKGKDFSEGVRIIKQ